MADYKKFRVDNNLTQKKVAEILGIPVPFLSQIENNKRPMPGDKLSKLLNNDQGWDIEALGVPPSEAAPARPRSGVQADVEVLRAKNAQLEELVKRLEEQNERYWALIEKLTTPNK